MTFAHPNILPIAAAVVAVAGLLLVWAERRAMRDLGRFASATRLPELTASLSRTRARGRDILLLLALALFGLALARPQLGHTWEERPGRGLDVLFALDTSRSMLAEDVRPNRLERARLAMIDFVDKLDGDRVGLVAFAGEAFLLCPPTQDYEAFRTSLNSVDTDIIPRPGTNIAAAIDEARATFGQTERYRFLVIISDGEELDADSVAAARRAAAEGAVIFTIGIGSAAGEVIPIRQPDGSVDLLRDADGRTVVTRLDESRLREIADAGNAFYAHLGLTGEGLQRVYHEGLGAIPREEREGRRVQVPVERFSWPLALALVLLVIELVMGDRRRLPHAAAATPGGIRSGGAAALAALAAVLALPPDAGAAAIDDAAHQRLAAGDLAGAVSIWESLATSRADPRLHFNAGAALLRGGDPEGAIRRFDRALPGASPRLQRDTLYNRGHARFALGAMAMTAEPPGRDRTIAEWEAALQDFTAAAELDPSDADAAFNRDRVAGLLSQLKDEQPPEEPPPGDPQAEPDTQQEPPGPQDQPGQQPDPAGQPSESQPQDPGGHQPQEGTREPDPQEPGADPGSGPGQSPQPGSEPQPQTGPQPEPGPSADPGQDPTAAPQPEPGEQPKAQPEPGDQPHSQPGPGGPDAAAQPGDPPQPGADPDTPAEPAPGDQPGTPEAVQPGDPSEPQPGSQPEPGADPGSADPEGTRSGLAAVPVPEPDSPDGRMSRADAAALLDSQNQRTRLLPITRPQDSAPSPSQRRRDW